MDMKPDLPLEGLSLVSSRKAPRWSVRTFLVGLVLACLFPGLIGVSGFFAWEYRKSQAELERDTIQTARALGQAVDSQIFQVRALAYGLAGAESLARGDFGAFYRQARQTLRQADLGVDVVLADVTGRQLVNTMEEFGKPLPLHGNLELIRRVFETGKPVVSDLFVGSVRQRPLIAVAVPVVLGTNVRYALNIAILPEKLNDVLNAQGLPPEWVATVLDSKGTILARSREPERFIGQKAPETFLRPALASSEGAVDFVMKDGVPVLSVFTRSPAINWLVAVNIPRNVLADELSRRLSMLILGAAGLFGLGLALAWLLGEEIARSFRALVASAVALGAGKKIFLPTVRVKEAAEVTRALGDAADLLAERSAALQEANRTLGASEERYRTLFTNMTEGFALGEPIFDGEGHTVDFRFLEANEAFYAETGTQKGMLGRPVLELLPDLGKHLVAIYGQVTLTGQARRFEDFNADIRRYHDIYAFCPTPGRFAVLIRDITEQKQVEEELRLAKERFETALSSVRVRVSNQDRDLRYTWIYSALSGPSAEQVLGLTDAGLLESPDDAKAIEALKRQVIYTGEGIRREVVVASQGLPQYFDMVVEPQRDAAGRIIGVVCAAIDLTERKRIELSLRRSEERLLLALDAARMISFDHDVATDRIKRQGNTVKYLGLDFEDTSENYFASIHPEDRPGFLQVLRSRTPENPEYSVMYRIRLPSGSYRWIADHARAVFDDSGCFAGAQGIFMDFEAQKQTEFALAHERKLLAAIVDNIPVMLCMYDPSLQRFKLNRHAEKVLGWSTEDANDGDFLAKIYPDPGYRQAVSEYMQQLVPGWRELHAMGKDGSLIPSDWANVLLDDDTFIGIGIDGRERKAAEAALAMHSQRQALLLEVASNILQTWGEKAELARVVFDKVRGHLNADICLNFAICPETADMQLIAGFGIPEEMREKVEKLAIGQAFCGTVAATGLPLMADHERIENDDRGCLARAMGVRAYACQPLYGLDGAVIGTFSMGRIRQDSFTREEVDFLQTLAYLVSLAWERWRIEQQLREVNGELERRVEARTAELVAANRELEAFTFATSHDLRGPLGRISSFSTLLKRQYRDRLEGDGLLFLDFIHQNATRLNQLVDDLLNHARVAQQDMELEPVDVPTLVRSVLSEKAEEIRQMEAQIKIGIAPAGVLGNAHALTQALGNLVQNALKYSASARPPIIEIGGEVAEGRFRLWVRDNGIGFHMAYHDKIFEIFRRLHTYSEYEGNGVGLALVKRAMERMGGRVWAESEPGQGATFFLELQLAEACSNTVSIG